MWYHPSQSGTACVQDVLGDNQSWDTQGKAIDCGEEQKPAPDFHLCVPRETEIIITRESTQWTTEQYDDFIEPMINLDGYQY